MLSPCPKTVRENVGSLRAERHANSDFVDALTGHIGHNAVDADKREREAKQSQGGGQTRADLKNQQAGKGI